jgi:hypothetical protein
VKNFYLSLPKQGQVRIEIPYYTDVLKGFNYVRVIPDISFIEGCSIPLEYRNAFYKISYPAYYVPIKRENVHWGFILKGKDKHTPSYTNWLRCFNFDDLFRDEGCIVMVEGMKDAYIFLENGIPVIAYLTSFPAKDLIDLAISRGKFIVFCPDNPVIDLAGKNAGDKFKKYMELIGYKSFLVFNVYHGDIKDFGDYFILDKREMVLRSFDVLKGLLLLREVFKKC